MNKKKKATNLSIQDANNKKHILSIQNKKKNVKVVKSKLKLAHTNSKSNQDSSSNKKAKKSILNLERKSIKKVVNKKVISNENKKGRKTKVTPPDDVKQSKVQAQNKSKKMSSVIVAKRPKGRPRLNPGRVNDKAKPVKQPKVSKTQSCLVKVKNTSETSKSKSSVKKKSAVTKPSKNVAFKSSPSIDSKEKRPKQIKVSKKTIPAVTEQSSPNSALTNVSTSKIKSPTIADKKLKNKSPTVSKSTNKIGEKLKSSLNKTVASSKKKPVKKSPDSSIKRSKKRGHRVASLNAIAKVKVLCESDRDSFNKTANSSKTTASQSKPAITISTKSHESKSKDEKPTPSRPKPSSVKAKQQTQKSKSKPKSTKSIKVNKEKLKIRKKKKVKRNLVDKDVEIIDTRRCKRMASLNASAMMAATYLPETRIVKHEPLEPPLPQVNFTEPASTVSEIIEQVVSDHWSSTVEQHIEISPGSLSNSSSEQNCKTTVKTTVKHVKLRGNGTVVETISTQFEEQNILPESLNVKKSSQVRKASSRQNVSVSNLSTKESPSAFTPCTSTSPYLGSSVVSSQPNHSFISTSEHAKKRTSRTKERQSANPTDAESPKKSRSIIRKYEVKTIETRTVNESSPSSMMSNSVIFANSSSTPLLNSSCLPRVSQPPLMSYIYPHHTPFNLVPPTSNLPTHSENAFGSESAPPSALNYINFSPFNSPIFQYQPLASALAPLSSASFPSPISVPFLLSNTAQQFPNSYSLTNQRPAHLPVSSLLGLSYLNPSANSCLYPPPNSVINILPSNSGSSPGCALVHRPVPYHPQSGHMPPACNSNISNLVNNSIFASSPLYGNLTPQSSLFQYSALRSPSVASIRHINVPLSYNQPAVVIPSATAPNNNNESIQIQHSVDTSTSSAASSANTISSGQRNSSAHSNGSINNGDICKAVPLSNNVRRPEDIAASGHIQQLANIANSIARVDERPNASFSKTIEVNRKSYLGKKTPGTTVNDNNGISANISNQNGQSVPKSINLGRMAQAKAKTIHNGILKRSEGPNSSNNSTKKLKLSKSVEQNGSRDKSILQNGNSNRSVKETNTLNKVQCHDEKSTSKPQVFSEEPVAHASPLTSARLLPLNNPSSLKKNRRPIVHGWSWEGESLDRYIFVNNDDQPYLRKCFPAIKHFEGDIIRVRDCVLLKSGPRKTDLPFVAKITALWESHEKEMMMSLLWYYRPEHTEIQESYISGEIYASKHRDSNSVACIDDKCYVLTYNEFCRYKRQKLRSHSLRKVDLPTRIVPQGLCQESQSQAGRIPPINILPELVFCCRKVFDFRQKRIMKNPNFKICE